MQNIFNQDSPFIFLAIGPQRSGKTYCLKYIFSKITSKFDYGFVFSKTSFNGDYDWIPPQYRFKEISEDQLEKIQQYQEKIIKKMGTFQSPSCFIIIDDQAGMSLTKPKMKSLFNTSRHYKISIFLLTQSTKHIYEDLINNTSYVAIFRVPNDKSMKDIQKYFMSESHNISHV